MKVTLCTGCVLDASHGENRNINNGIYLLSVGPVQKANSGLLVAASLREPLRCRLSSIVLTTIFIRYSEKRVHIVFSPVTVGFFDYSWVSLKATEKRGIRLICSDCTFYHMWCNYLTFVFLFLSLSMQDTSVWSVTKVGTSPIFIHWLGIWLVGIGWKFSKKPEKWKLSKIQVTKMVRLNVTLDSSIKKNLKPWL